MPYIARSMAGERVDVSKHPVKLSRAGVRRRRMGSVLGDRTHSIVVEGSHVTGMPRWLITRGGTDDVWEDQRQARVL